MPTHPNARLTPLGRERLLRRHMDHGEPLLALAAQAGISLRTAYKWLARYRSGGHTSLADRRSVRRTQRRTLDPQQLQHAVDLRHQRCTAWCQLRRRIAKAVGAPLSTVGRAMKAPGLGRLRNLKPKPPVQRYQWEKPGDMIHVDTKQLARFERVGHRITGDRRQRCSRGAGYEKVYVAIDDATRLAVAPRGALADTSRCCPMSRRPPLSASWLVPWAGSASRGSPGVVSSRTTVLPTAPANGGRLAPQWISSPSAPGPTHRGPTARRSGSSGHSAGSGPMEWPSRPLRSGSAGFLAIWGSLTAADATWPLVASALSSAWSHSSLNDLGESTSSPAAAERGQRRPFQPARWAAPGERTRARATGRAGSSSDELKGGRGRRRNQAAQRNS